MSMHKIYVEVSDEITTVIERLKQAPETAIALVAPKGAILLQSIVNLKLAKKAANDAEKNIVLVTTDKIGKNLATQLGLAVVANERDAEAALAGTFTDSAELEDDSQKVISGVRIHRYYDEEDTPEENSDEAKPEPIVIPKKMMKEEPKKEELAAPIVIPPKPELVVETIPADTPLTRTSIDLPPEEATPEPVIEEVVADTEEEVIAPEPKTQVVAAANPVIAQSRPLANPKAPLSPADMRKKRRLKFSIFLLALILLAAGAASFLFLPVTQATIAVPATSWSKTYTVTAKSSDANGDMMVPAEVITGEATEKLSFKATGTKKVGELAKGSAAIYNGSDSEAQTLPAGATLSASGRTFVTDTAVTVPGVKFTAGKKVDGSATVAITATEPGPESNLGSVAATITSPNTLLYAQLASTSGGSSRDVTIVSATDIANARNALTDQLREKSKEKLIEQIGDRAVKFSEENDVFAFNNFTSNVASGQEVENGEVEATATMQRLVVPTEAPIKLAEQRATVEADTSKRTAIENVSITKFEIAQDNKSATLTVQADGKESAIIPLETLRTTITGKTERAAQGLVALSVPNSTLTFTRKPSWWPLKRLPYFSKWLSLDVKYE